MSAKHEWMAVDGGPGATVCHMWCAKCGTLWSVADMNDPERTNRYFVAGWVFEADGASRPSGGFADEPDCPPRVAAIDIAVSMPPPPPTR